MVDRKQEIIRACGLIALGTAVAFSITTLYPPLRRTIQAFWPRLLPGLPRHAVPELAVVLFLFLLVFTLRSAGRTWRSLSLGFISARGWLWVSGVALVWLYFEIPRAAALGFLLTALAYITVILSERQSRKAQDHARYELEPDLPVQENGEDLLGRQAIVDSLVSMITLEAPTIIALTGGYGDGKTSVLNLTVGELKRLPEKDRPIIVRFSPWLAGDSDRLILSLLNSIVAAIRQIYVAPGLGRNAYQYARALSTLIPKAERLKGLLGEPSQEEQLNKLAADISRVPRRVLVALDDIDRMEAKELETVFKLLRGSEKLASATFICSFDRDELASILKATRHFQDTSKFVEKFFPVQIPLPKVDSDQLQQLFSDKVANLLKRYGLEVEEFSKGIENIWENGAGSYLVNLRRLKLFLNKMGRSLEQIGGEVNFWDFTRLELVRDIAPQLYEIIYQRPEYFYNGELAFETRFKGLSPFDREAVEKQRTGFYEGLVKSVSGEKQYVFQLVEELFPHFAKFRGNDFLVEKGIGDGEKERRIFHPRYFRQYFLLKVPSELFSQEEFKDFSSTLRNSDEKEAFKAFDAKFTSLLKEDFKRWHFMHLVEKAIGDFGLEAAKGICRGMARNASIWGSDAFEFMIAIRCTHQTIERITPDGDRQVLLRKIVSDSTSDLYMLYLVSEKDSDTLAADLEEIKPALRQHLRKRYLSETAPSVFEQFQGPNAVQGVDPTRFLFAWRRLGGEAESHQRQYLEKLFARSPKNLDEFLKLMFRVDFIDDYTALKPLIDYDLLSKLINSNEEILDKEKVKQFRERYWREQSGAQQS